MEEIEVKNYKTEDNNLGRNNLGQNNTEESN